MENLHTDEVVEETEVNEAVASETENTTAVPASLARPLTKVLGMIKRIGKKAWIISAAVVVLLLGVIVFISGTSNTYKTPLNLTVQYMNSRKIPDMDNSARMLNGFAEAEFKAFCKVLEKADMYEDAVEDMQDDFEERIEELEDAYGENYKYSYEIIDKETLEKEDLRDIRDDFKDLADRMKDLIDETEEWNSDDWEEAADDIGLTKSELRKFVKALENLYDVFRNVEVTAGYEVVVNMIVDGSELDEPEENEETICVYKINGRWVAVEMMNMVFEVFPFF